MKSKRRNNKETDRFLAGSCELHHDSKVNWRVGGIGQVKLNEIFNFVFKVSNNSEGDGDSNAMK